MKTEAQKLMTKLRTTIPYGNMNTLLSLTSVIRIIKYFPKNGNQQQKKMLCYDMHGQVITAFKCNYLNINEMRDILPKRVAIIEDYNYMIRLKDFDEYKEEV